MAGAGPEQAAVRISGLDKSFGVGFLHRSRRQVLHGLELTVHRNEIFGYLGPNGSGKTTTLKVLMGLLAPDRGDIQVLGLPLASPEWRFRCGFLPEHPYFYDYLTAREYLDYAGRLFGQPRALRQERGRELLAVVGLLESADTPLRRFSKGMTQRLGIAQALINDPEIVFLDEPMSGLDPIGRYLVRKLILDLKGRGKTIFFSTHILSDAETLCDRVALLRAGHLVNVGRIDEIVGLGVSHVEILATGLSPEAVESLQPHLKGRHNLGERWRLDLGEDKVGTVVRLVEEAGGRILSVYPVRESLEEYFFREVATSGTGGDPWRFGD